MKKALFKNTCSLKKMLVKDLRAVRTIYKDMLTAKQKNSSNAEWLSDNYYILEKEGRTLVKELGKHLFLPCKDHEYIIYADLQEILRQNDNIVTQELLDEFITNRQKERYYQSCELYSLPQMLKVCLLHNSVECLTTNKKLGNIIKSLRGLGSIDFDSLNQKHLAIEKVLCSDPAGVYPHMDEQSRAMYIESISKTAQREGLDELTLATDILKLCKENKDDTRRHIGFYIMSDRQKEKKRKILAKISLSALLLLPVGLSLFFSIAMEKWWFFPLLYLPCYEITKIFVEYFSQKKFCPSLLPRMQLKGIIPQGSETVIVVSALLSSPDKKKSTTKRLEQLLQTNGRGAVQICLLADLKQSKYPNMPEDKAVIDSVSRQIKELNQKHGSKFVLLVRKRTFSKTQNAYMGWERKRGAITELVRLIKNEETPLEFFCGNKNELKKAKYIICLDSDTKLLMDSVAELVGAALHPLNQPVIADGAVRAGYGIITPKMSTDLHMAGSSSFSRIMAGTRGISVYDTISSDFYMDIFKEGIFAGKGLIDVDCFYKIMNYKLPDEKILSHDSIESGFLRTAYMSDVEMTDGFPLSVTSFKKRQHRWIRGDIQNLDYCFNKELNSVTKYKLFDNVRRAVTPFFSLFALIFTVIFTSGPSNLIAVLVILSVCGSQLFSAVMTVIYGGPDMISRKYYSKVSPEALLCISQAVMLCVMFTDTALNSLDATVRAFYRKDISKKNMLEWVTAADSEKNGGFLSCVSTHALATLISLILLYFATGSIAKLLFFCSSLIIWVSYFTGKSAAKTRLKLKEEDRETLLGYAAAFFRYYDDLFTKEDHYLPPDNLQEAPVQIIAHRSSPTNIGLMMLGFLSARDFGFIDNTVLFDRITKMVNTIEQLEKWHGNLLNWYDLKTLVPLRPKYVSTVDSGNFVSNLVVLKNGLIEYGCDNGLISRITKLIDQTDLSSFYNKNRKLFHIGYDMEKEELTNSFYDLLMSEARITSYFAIASRQIPKKHWGALGRTLARQGGFTGPVSWTGTMFEYFMPALFLPSYEGSLCYEALKFCHYCQKRRVHSDIPYGISESGFYAFDPQLNYQYKAHGVQKLGLKRGLNTELVISPYSSFLALTSSNEAFYNIKKLERLKMTGRYGFYEAIDYTKGRVKNNPQIIKSYMAHHIGMSLLAINNALNNDIMVNRFINDSRMSCACELLEEKIPGGAVVFEDVITREIPDKTARRHAETEEFDTVNPLSPRMSILSNGEISTLLTDVGAGVSTYQTVDITRRSEDLLKNPSGIFAFLRTKEKIFSLSYAPLYDKDIKHRVEFGSKFIAYYAQHGTIESGMMVSLHKEISCEQRKIIIKNKGGKKIKIDLLFYLEPILTSAQSEAAHPVFSKLFIENEYDKTTNSIIFKRRLRDNEPSVFLAVGLKEDEKFVFETDREKVLDCPQGILSVTSAFDKNLSGCSGVHDNCLAIKKSFEIIQKGQIEITLLLCTAPTKEEAIKKLIMVRRENLNVINSAKSPLSDLSLEARVSSMILPYLHYPLRESKETITAIRENTLGQNALWSIGISGDRKIVLLEILSAADAERSESFIKALLKLRLCFVKIDLVIIFSEGGTYDQPITSAVNQAIRSCGAEQLVGTDGGIYMVDLEKAPPYASNLLKAAACFIVDAGLSKAHPLMQSYMPLEILPVSPVKAPGGLRVNNGMFSGKSFFITGKPQLPWCHILANKTFGTLVSNNTLGYTWAVNSRENKLTPWQNDTRTDNQGEQLLLNLGKKYYNLINGATAEFCEDYAKYHSSVGSLLITVTVTVPQKGMRKNITVCIKNHGEDIEYKLIYYTEPVLGWGQKTARYICAKWENKMLILRNSFNTSVKGVMTLSAKGGADEFVCDRGAFLSGRISQNTLSPLIDNCAAVILRRRAGKGQKIEDEFVLSFAANEQAAIAMANLPDRPKKENSIKIKTPDSLLNNMVNNFMPNQIIKGRMMGRTAFYQCSGAYGYRDQLQDSGAALLIDSTLTKQQITKACAHQFIEGDVLHWWHTLPKNGGGEKGVRTKYSDDLLWLPLAVADYVKKTGDIDILNTEISYITAPVLSEHEHEVYLSIQKSNIKESVYKHCLRAIHKTEYGEHNLPLMGGGDWCDGYNKVGLKGKGESVWVAMFLSMVLTEFSEVCALLGECEDQDFCIKKSEELKVEIDKHAYDGEWYLRAFYDNGEKMGSKISEECKIDSMTQSFAVLCGMPDKERVQSAIDSAIKHLVDYNNGLIKLFTPAFNNSINPVGYVISYPVGIRENGGQYTHGIIWLLIALLRMGNTDKAYELIKMLNPAEKCRDREMAEKYAVEPYYMAADVYSNPKKEGRGGWSIYTGAAGWYYRLIVEELLGIHYKGDHIELEPNLPSQWEGFELELDIRNTKISVTVTKKGQKTIVPLDQKTHKVEL